jgi:Flp pilus assembly protein TadG
MCRGLIRSFHGVRRDERGVQLVELAIVIPLIALLLAAVAEFGRYFYEYTTLAKGARIATRYLATAHTDGTDDPAAKNLVVYGNLGGTGSPILSGLDPTNVQITRRDASGGTMTGGVPNTVTVEIVNFQHVSLFNLSGLTGSSATLNIPVKPSVTMKYLLTQPLI